MAYRFKLDELSTKGVRRIAREQIQRAVMELGRDEMSAASVHETRKVVKRLKSLLRLVRPSISEKTFRGRYRRIAKIGDELAGARDSHVLIQSIGKLETRFGPESIKVLQPLRSLLSASAPDTRVSKNPTAGRRALAMAIMECQKLDKVVLKAKGFEVIAAGIEDTYHAGRRNFARAYKRPSDEAFHELRKTVQWHWRQMALMSRAWPEYFEVRIANARQLAEILGNDHDLAVLEAEVRKLSAQLPANAAPIENLIIQRKDELRQEARPYAERIFVEKPAEFVRRIAVYWDSARNMQHLRRDSKDEAEPAKRGDATREADTAPGSGSEHRGEITQPVPVASPRMIR